MEKRAMCRICLVENVHMHTVSNKKLQEVYEKLTDTPFLSDDCKPVLACFFCYTKLKQCWQLQRKCLEAEEVLRGLTSLSNRGPVEFYGGLIKTTIVHVNIGTEAAEDVELKVEQGSDSESDNGYLDQDIPSPVYQYESGDDEPLITLHPDVEEHVPETRTVNVTTKTLNRKKETNIKNILNKLMKNGRTDLKVIRRSKRRTSKYDALREILDNNNKNIITAQCPSTFESSLLRDTEIKEDQDSFENVEEIEDTTDAVPQNPEYINDSVMAPQDLGAVDRPPFMEVQYQGKPDQIIPETIRDANEAINAQHTFTENLQNISQGVIRPLPSSSIDGHYFTTIQFNRKEDKIIPEKIPKTIETTNTLPQNLQNMSQGVIRPLRSSSVQGHSYIKIQYQSKEDQIIPEKIPNTDETYNAFPQHFQNTLKEVTTTSHLSGTDEGLPYIKIQLQTKEDQQIPEKVVEKNEIKKTPATKKAKSERNTKKKPTKKDQNNTEKIPQTIHGTSTCCEKPYKCQICHRCFTAKHNLKVHNLIHTGEKHFKCEVCLREFNVKANLDAHMRTHTGEKPYKCETCGRCFRTTNHLKDHMRTHTGAPNPRRTPKDASFPCTQCERVFSEKSSLIRHGRTHTGERPYKCDICQRTFAILGNMKRHSRTAHSGEEPDKRELAVMYDAWS